MERSSEREGLPQERRTRNDGSNRRAFPSKRGRLVVLAASGGALMVVVVLAAVPINNLSAWTTTTMAAVSSRRKNSGLSWRKPLTSMATNDVEGDSRAAEWSSKPSVLMMDAASRPHLRRRKVDPSSHHLVHGNPIAGERTRRRLATPPDVVRKQACGSGTRPADEAIATTARTLLGDLWHRLLARTKKPPTDDGATTNPAAAATTGTTNATRNNNGTRHHGRANATATDASNATAATAQPTDEGSSGSSRSSSNATTTTNTTKETSNASGTEAGPGSSEKGAATKNSTTATPVEGSDVGPNDALTTEEEVKAGVEARVEHGDDEDEDDDKKSGGAGASGGGGGTSGGGGTDDKHGASSSHGTDKKDIHPSDSEAPLSAGNGTNEDADSIKKEEAELEKAEQELQAEETKVRRVSGFGAAAGIFAMIFTAWQISENPDGIYAAMCRLVLTICNLVFRLALAPCHRCCPGWLAHSGAHYRHTYGHVPATLDYGYRDPALELS